MKIFLVVIGLCVGFQVVCGLWIVWQGLKSRAEDFLEGLYGEGRYED